MDPTTEEYFEMEDKTGGPINPLHGLQPLMESFLNKEYPTWTDYPLYKYLKQHAQKEKIPLVE